MPFKRGQNKQPYLQLFCIWTLVLIVIDVKCAVVFLELSEIQFKMSVIKFDFRVVLSIK